MLKDISTIEDIEFLVHTFYDKIRVNGLIGPIFIGVIRDNWPVHLEKMVRFWQTILLEDHTYFGSPFLPHAELPVEQKHFDAWLTLWSETVDNHFAGKKADEAKWRAEKMATLFLSKILYYKNNSAKPLM